VFFFFSSRRRHTRSDRDWSSDVCSSDLPVSLVIFSNKMGGKITASEAGAPAVSGTAFRVYVESLGAVGQPASIQSGIAIANNTEIGRASCRERAQNAERARSSKESRKES